MAHKGYYRPIHPTKYKGNPTRIVYRSNYERILMHKLDIHPSVIEWSSESVRVPYRSPLDNKIHRYFVDFYVKMKDKSGNIVKKIIEVKPYKQTIPPPTPTQPSKSYLREMVRYQINKTKWEAARAWASSHGMQFSILTEDDLGIKRG